MPKHASFAYKETIICYYCRDHNIAPDTGHRNLVCPKKPKRTTENAALADDTLPKEYYTA